MDFGIQLLVTLGIACAICIPLVIYKYKEYRKKGKSIKYLELKVLITVGLPIMSVPFLLSNELTPLDKLIVIILMLITGVAYVYFITSARRSFRKIMGLSLEDEHTGEVIKDNKKKG
jgi:Ca2+/Na+ antiporter